LAEDGRDRCARCSALQALELDSAATSEEIKNAHRMLVKVWHPDRFQGDAKLKAAADEKLKAINAAYVFLTAKAGKRTSRPPRPSSGFAAGAGPRRRTAARRRAAARLIPSPIALLGFAVLVCGFLILALFLKAADSYFASQPVTGRFYTGLRAEIAANVHAAARSIWGEAGQSLHGLLPQKTAAASTVTAQPEPAAQYDQPVHRTQSLHQRELGAAHAAPVRLTPYITTGLTQDEVKAIEGAPTSATEDKLVYQGSELYFTNGKLAGWKIDPASAPIRVKLWPEAPVDPNLESFHVGSSKSAVLAVQGTPTFLSEEKFGYGGSTVYFRGDRVVSWKNDPTTVPLRVAP
jgi:hypothetical protein